MNEDRRRTISKALNMVEDARELLAEVANEEIHALNDLPEDQQRGERGKAMQENIRRLNKLETYLDVISWEAEDDQS